MLDGISPLHNSALLLSHLNSAFYSFIQQNYLLEACVTTVLRQIIGQTKNHPSLIPLFVFIAAGGTGAALCVWCLALFNPDVSWDRKN